MKERVLLYNIRIILHVYKGKMRRAGWILKEEGRKKVLQGERHLLQQCGVKYRGDGEQEGDKSGRAVRDSSSNRSNWIRNTAGSGGSVGLNGGGGGWSF